MNLAGEREAEYALVRGSYSLPFGRSRGMASVSHARCFIRSLDHCQSPLHPVEFIVARRKGVLCLLVLFLRLTGVSGCRILSALVKAALSALLPPFVFSIYLPETATISGRVIRERSSPKCKSRRC